MSKFSSPDSFSAYLTEEFTWRVREISDVRKAASSVGSGYEPAIRKAGLALVYAHWEGYVKFCSEAYLRYIAARKILLSQLADEFLAVELGSAFKKYMNSADGVTSRVEFLADMKKADAARFKSFHEKGFSAGGNLNYDRFCLICFAMKILPAKVVDDPDFLDTQILAVRNRIAHGSSITVTPDELVRASDFVIEAMRAFRTETENLLISKKYLRPTAAA